MRYWLIFGLLFQLIDAAAQQSPLFINLPVGQYNVGFKIVSFYDESRVMKPEYDYFGEKVTGNRYRKINLHIWYPAKPNSSKETLTYGDYSSNYLIDYTNQKLNKEHELIALTAERNGFQRFGTSINDQQWEQVVTTPLIAKKDAQPLKKEFPLLVGMLRPLSTSVTNEMMASNGYVVVMVLSANLKWPEGFITDIEDMRQAVTYARKNFLIQNDNIGTYGFSGSGFAQLLFAMNDSRVKAHADIESGYYGLWELITSSNLFENKKLAFPFFHIYSKELAKRDKHFNQFYNHKYSPRYHLLVNQDGQNHWDVATEGRASNTILHMRGNKEPGLNAGFELSNIYLLNFFNAVLKKDKTSIDFLSNKKAIGSYPDSIWNFTQYKALPLPPDRHQFAEMIKRNGIDNAITKAREFYAGDSTLAFLSENALNQTARDMEELGKKQEAVMLINYTIEIYPQQGWLINDFAKMQERFGNTEEAIRLSESVIKLLENDKGDEKSLNQRLLKDARERRQRLKK